MFHSAWWRQRRCRWRNALCVHCGLEYFHFNETDQKNSPKKTTLELINSKHEMKADKKNCNKNYISMFHCDWVFCCWTTAMPYSAVFCCCFHIFLRAYCEWILYARITSINVLVWEESCVDWQNFELFFRIGNVVKEEKHTFSYTNKCAREIQTSWVDV